MVNRWYLQILHNQTALALKARLLFRPEHRGDVGARSTRRTRHADEAPVADAVPRCCRPPCTRRPSGSSSASPSPRPTSTTSASGSSSRSPVFATDAISSTAYATDEILVVLLVQAAIGLAAFDSTWCRSRSIVAVLLAIVVTSYRQTIFAYPSGGGSYIVSRENLGTIPSLVAGSSLLVDYILTVAV